MNPSEIWTDVKTIRQRAPLVQNITNYVAMNTTANALLAIGASPVMAHAAEEVDDMVRLVGGVGGALVVNIGTLSEPWVRAMASALATAAICGVPIILDPVGAGATPYRTHTCRALLAQTRPAVIRGNASEIMALLNAEVQTKGVDSAHSSDDAAASAARLALAHRCVVSVSGATDLITDGATQIAVHNGHPLMTRVTGLGCTASALTGAFTAVNPEPRAAAAHAMAVMGICGELAAELAQGPGTLQAHFYDALFNLTEDILRRRLR